MKLIPVFFFLSLTLLLFACSKDKYETKPRIEIKDISNDEVRRGEISRFRLTFFDKEGDLSQASLYCERVRTNKTPIPNPNDNDKRDDLPVTLPEFPQKNTGEISIDLVYDFLDEDPNRNDSMFFRFTLRDKEGNQSDTISSKIIVALN